jgi:hypothetical protein
MGRLNAPAFGRACGSGIESGLAALVVDVGWRARAARARRVGAAGEGCRVSAARMGDDQFDPIGVGIRPVNLFAHYREDFYIPPQRGKFTFVVSMRNSGSRPVIIRD